MIYKKEFYGVTNGEIIEAVPIAKTNNEITWDLLDNSQLSYKIINSHLENGRIVVPRHGSARHEIFVVENNQLIPTTFRELFKY